MYRMLSKIAFEWYCAKNNVTDYYQEFDNIITFITTGEGENPVSIIQKSELYEAFNHQMALGSHTLVAFETDNGEINVIISLFGLLIYRVIVTKNKPEICKQNFLFVELRTDSSRREITHKSVNDAIQCFNDFLSSDKNYEFTMQFGIKLVIPKSLKQTIAVKLYAFLFDMIKYLANRNDDVQVTNENLNRIFCHQLNNITQASILHKKSIKRFVNDNFSDGHMPIQINPHTSNKKSAMLFYVVYLIGMSGVTELDDDVFQRIVREGLPYTNGEELIISDEIEKQFKEQILNNKNYSEILEKGADIVKKWNN